MAEPGDETTGEFGEEAAEERRAQGSTVAGLNAFSAGVDSGTREKLGYGDPDAAMLALSSAVEKGTLQVPRLLVLDSLVRLAKRGGRDQLKARDQALNTLLQALIADKRGPEADLGGAVSTVRVALDSVASLKDLDTAAHPWEVFVRQAGPALQLTEAEVEKPMCNDREVVIKGPYKATGVTVEFHTDASPGELRQFCDPRHWHECSAYQKKMTPWTGPGAMPDEDRPPDGWRRDLLETVQLAPGKTLVTPLRFTHTIQAQNDPSWVHLDYVMIGDTPEIKVDEGFLDVRRVMSGQHSGRTRVVAKKAIFFADPLLTNWPTVACDTFWMDLVIDAAVGCLGPHATIDSTGGKPKMAASKEVPLTEVIERATDAARQSITAYGKLAGEAATQLTGDSPAKADKWVELTTRTWAQAAQDAARAWTTYVALLQAVAESGGAKDAKGAKDTKDTQSKGGGT